MLVALSAVGGLLFGYDTGVVSGAMVLVRKVRICTTTTTKLWKMAHRCAVLQDFKLSDGWHEVIVASTVAAAFATSLVAGRASDRFGRRPVILAASVAFTVGSFFMGLAAGKWTLLLGRLVVGAAIGLSSVAVPTYIAESCPAGERGSLVVVNNAFITGGQFAAGLICGVLAGATEGWRWMLGLAAVPAVLQFFGVVALPESPRHLVLKGEKERCVNTIILSCFSQHYPYLTIVIK